MINGSKYVLENHFFEKGISKAVQEEHYVNEAIHSLKQKHDILPANIPYKDITDKIMEMFIKMYDSKEISPVIKRLKYETKRTSTGNVVIIRM